MPDASRPTTKRVFGGVRARQGRRHRYVVGVLLFGVLLTSLGVVFAWI